MFMNIWGTISLNHAIKVLGGRMGTPVEDVIVDELAQLWKHRADARNMWMAPTTARLLGAEHDPETAAIELRKRIEELGNHDQRTVLLVMFGYRSARSSVGARLKDLETSKAFGRPLKQGSLRKLGSEGSVELSKALVALDPEHQTEDSVDRWFDEFYTPQRISEMQQRWTAAIGGEDAVTERVIKMMESPAVNAATKRAYESFVAQQKPDPQSEQFMKLLMQMPSIVHKQTEIIRVQQERQDAMRTEIERLRASNDRIAEGMAQLTSVLKDVELVVNTVLRSMDRETSEEFERNIRAAVAKAQSPDLSDAARES